MKKSSKLVIKCNSDCFGKIYLFSEGKDFMIYSSWKLGLINLLAQWISIYVMRYFVIDAIFHPSQALFELTRSLEDPNIGKMNFVAKPMMM